MYVTVMTGAKELPDEPGIALAAQLGAEMRRLSPVSIEITHAGPATYSPMPGIDINTIPAAGREKRLLIADMDSTMISVECIDELADFAGQKEAVAGITERAMQGELDFEEALDARVALLEGVTRADLDACRRARVAPNPGAETLVKTMAARGAVTALVSGGFTDFAEPVGRDLGFEHIKANRLDWAGDRLTGRVHRPVVTSKTKRETLEALCTAHDIPVSATLAVGDGANDGEMVALAGLGAAYRAKPKLREVADVTLDHAALTALLALQGIAEPGLS